MSIGDDGGLMTVGYKLIEVDGTKYVADCNDSIIVKSIRVLAGGCPIFGEVDFASGPKNIIDNFSFCRVTDGNLYIIPLKQIEESSTWFEDRIQEYLIGRISKVSDYNGDDSLRNRLDTAYEKIHSNIQSIFLND